MDCARRRLDAIRQQAPYLSPDRAATGASDPRPCPGIRPTSLDGRELDPRSVQTSEQVLDHLGFGPPEEPKHPPAVHEGMRVPVDEEGREMEAP